MVIIPLYMSTCTIYLIENTIAELTIVRNFTDTVYPPLFWLENIAPSCCNTSVNWLHKSVGTGGGGATKLCKVTPPPFFLVKIFYKSSPPPPFQFAPDAPASHNFHSIYSVEMKLYISLYLTLFNRQWKKSSNTKWSPNATHMNHHVENILHQILCTTND